MPKTAALAYSGGLDTSCMISWLKELYGYDEVVAVLVDVGQAGDAGAAAARGRAAGADEVVVLDRRDAFAEEQVASALRANALYEGRYPLVSALSRPVIAAAVAELAQALGAEAAVHGCTGKGNDQLRFELAFKATCPGVKVLAPLRDRVWTRDEEIVYAQSRGIPVEARRASPYSIDENLLGRSIEAGLLEDPWLAPPEEAFALTASPLDAPPPCELALRFEQGLPVALDGQELSLAALLTELNARAGAYGIGRIDMVENRAVGIKSRELYEAPAALVLIDAHRSLEELVLTRAELRLKRELEPRWAELVYEGHWFSPAREALDAFVARTQERLDGELRIALRAGAATVCGRRSAQALYAETLASYAQGETFPHEAAEGFVRLAGLETELVARRRGAAVPA